LCSIYLSSCRLVRCHQDTRPLPTRRSSDLVSTGSTADLLEGVAEAMDAGETVAATFWSPHRALDELPLRFLEEPQRQLVERPMRSEEHTAELQSRFELVCRLLLEKKKDTTA